MWGLCQFLVYMELEKRKAYASIVKSNRVLIDRRTLQTLQPKVFDHFTASFPPHVQRHTCSDTFPPRDPGLFRSPSFDPMSPRRGPLPFSEVCDVVRVPRGRRPTDPWGLQNRLPGPRVHVTPCKRRDVRLCHSLQITDVSYEYPFLLGRKNVGPHTR